MALLAWICSAPRNSEGRARWYSDSVWLLTPRVVSASFRLFRTALRLHDEQEKWKGIQVTSGLHALNLQDTRIIVQHPCGSQWEGRIDRTAAVGQAHRSITIPLPYQAVRSR